MRRTWLRERSEDTNDMVIIPSGGGNYLVFETFGFVSIVTTAAFLDLFQSRDLAHIGPDAWRESPTEVDRRRVRA